MFVALNISYNFRFIINLMSGEDTAFHFNPRFGQGNVVRTTKINGKFQKEEKDGGMPFNRDKKFEIQFTVEPDYYQASLQYLFSIV